MAVARPIGRAGWPTPNPGTLTAGGALPRPNRRRCQGLTPSPGRVQASLRCPGHSLRGAERWRAAPRTPRRARPGGACRRAEGCGYCRPRAALDEADAELPTRGGHRRRPRARSPADQGPSRPAGVPRQAPRRLRRALRDHRLPRSPPCWRPRTSTPNRGEDTNHVANGLLLRADLHTLLDCGLIAVDPDDLRVVVAPSIRGSSYRRLHGRALRPREKGWRGASEDALRLRFEEFTQRHGT